MKIAVLSDTHLRDGQVLPVLAQNIVDKSELVLHAGDLTSEKPFEGLGERFLAVRGNCDFGLSLPEFLTYSCQGVKIGIVHGYQFRDACSLCAAFESDVRLVIFGHTHEPLRMQVGERTLFNPGSTTQRKPRPRCSMGVLTVDGADFALEHIYFY